MFCFACSFCSYTCPVLVLMVGILFVHLYVFNRHDICFWESWSFTNFDVNYCACAQCTCHHNYCWNHCIYIISIFAWTVYNVVSEKTSKSAEFAFYFCEAISTPSSHDVVIPRAYEEKRACNYNLSYYKWAGSYITLYVHRFCACTVKIYGTYRESSYSS